MAADSHTTVTKFPQPADRLATVCIPWHAREIRANFIRAAKCFVCGRDVAAPTQACRSICLYCAMERGQIEPVEREPPEWR